MSGGPGRLSGPALRYNRTMARGRCLSRREWLAGALLQPETPTTRLIDVHQHTNYHGRSEQGLLTHQQLLGAMKTVLLPAGSQFGLAASVTGNSAVLDLARRHPTRFVFFANELPDLPDTVVVLEKYLRFGARGIGEQKFPVACDSEWIQRIASVARDHHVPVLMHFQHEAYNFGFENFYKILDKFPSVNFIGHAQTFWGHIDAAHEPKVLYPDGPVTPGGLTDKWLADYPNLYGDLSAGSGMRALLRDEEFTRGFLSRHRNKLLYGSDCEDIDTTDRRCCGSRQLAALRRLAPDVAALDKILYRNAARLLKIA